MTPIVNLLNNQSVEAKVKTKIIVLFEIWGEEFSINQDITIFSEILKVLKRLNLVQGNSKAKS